jgi:hypothetical protein
VQNDKCSNSALCILHCESLFVLAVQLVLAAAAAELFELQPVRRVLFVLRRHVVALFALRALQNYVISRHTLGPQLSAVSGQQKHSRLIADR